MVTTVPRLEEVLRGLYRSLHPHHGLAMSVKRSLLGLYSQMAAGTVGRGEYARMRGLAKEQLTVLAREGGRETRKMEVKISELGSN